MTILKLEPRPSTKRAAPVAGCRSAASVSLPISPKRLQLFPSLARATDHHDALVRMTAELRRMRQLGVDGRWEYCVMTHDAMIKEWRAAQRALGIDPVA